MTFKAYDRDVKAIESDGKERFIAALKNGTTTFRVMPPYSERGVWFRKINEYYFKIGEQHVYMPSPRDFDQPDPIADYIESVYESGDTEEIAKVKDWKPRLRYLINAFILAEPTPMERSNIAVLKLPGKVLKDLKTLDTDGAAGYGDITNLEKGFNINVKREGKGINSSYTVTAHRQETNIHELLSQRNLVLENMTLPNLDEVYPPRSFQELTEILATLRSAGVTTTVQPSTPVPSPAPTIQIENAAPVPSFTIEPPPGS